MMRFAVLLVVAMTTVAAAQDIVDGGVMGFYFSDTVFLQETTDCRANFDSHTFLDGYIVLLGSPAPSVGGYEVAIRLLTYGGPPVWAVFAGGPNGWLNFGGDLSNFLVRYDTPVPCDANGSVVLGYLTMLVQNQSVDITFGPAFPSWAPGPAVLSADLETVFACELTIGGHEGTVAYINGPGWVPAGRTTLSAVKGMFH